MKRDRVKTFGTVLLGANALIAVLSLTNLFLVAAGAIQVEVPDAEDLIYDYDGLNGTLDVKTSFTVRNEGVYDVSNLDIDSTLTTSTGYKLIEFSNHDLRVRAGDERTFPIEVRMDVGLLASGEMLRFLVEDGSFELSIKVRADYTMGLTKFRSDERIEYPWLSPLTQLRNLLIDGNLSRALEEVLGWAGPIVHEWLAAAIVDAAMADGEWQQQDLGGWAIMDYRLWLNETTGVGALDAIISGEVMGFEWSMNGSVPLRLVDDMVYLEWEVSPDGT
jgi:hypothetical protein